MCGLKSKYILPDFTNYIVNFDLVGFQETKLTELDDIQFDEFKFFTKNRKLLSRVSSGGIALAVKKDLLNEITVIDTDCNLVLWFKVSKKLTKYDSDILCGIIYIPPENTRYSSNDPFNEIQIELDSLKSNRKKSGKYIVLSSILKRLLILFGGRVFGKKCWSLKLQENGLTLYLTCIKKLNHAYL